MIELFADEPLGKAACLKRAYGGDVLNTLVISARLGSRVGFISKIGDDPFGPALRREWQHEGVDLTCCPLVPGVNGVYFISLLPNGEREFSYRRASSAAQTLKPQDISLAYLKQARILLLSGITQAISEGAQAATLAAARLARSIGVVVAYDPNKRPELWRARGGNAAARAAVNEVLPFVDLLLPSLPADADVLTWKSEAPRESAVALMEHGVSFVGIKLGADGCQLMTRDESNSVVRPSPGVKIIDTTGAGDAWNAGLLHALTMGESLMEASSQANAVAAQSLQHRGAIPRR